jgi:hypothetical protein
MRHAHHLRPGRHGALPIAAGRRRCPSSMVANPTSIGPTWIWVPSIPCPRASHFCRPTRSRSRCRQGHLREAEAEFPPEPRSDVNRATAFATYHRPLTDGGIWATTIAAGVNSAREVTPVGEFAAYTFALMLETTVNVRDRHTASASFSRSGLPGTSCSSRVTARDRPGWRAPARCMARPGASAHLRS